jgi:cytochrome oxidase Cu insertion factor (SCO1/SenC/PrrC family)
VKVVTVLFQAMVLLSVTLTANSQSQTAGLRTTPVGVGDIAPDFTLPDQDGHKVTLADVRGKSPVVLVFYRGYW